MADIISDTAIILYVRPYQTADKQVVCFTKEHGKLRFIAYGACYPKSVKGRLLQPFAELHLTVQQGTRVDRLQNAELAALPQSYDMREMAYAAVATELVALLTEDGQAQEDIYELLQQTLRLLKVRNPRIMVLAFAIKLLQLIGLAPQLEACVLCGSVLEQEQGACFSALHGGVVCPDCQSKQPDAGYDPCSAVTRELWRSLLFLNLEQPEHFTLTGRALMELERILYRFIVFQTDKPLKSLQFLAQMQLR